MNTPYIPFNKPYMTGDEVKYIEMAYRDLHLSGDGAFTRRCQEWLELKTGCDKALLTHSCTAALEMAAMLIDIQPGDEVIMTSFTFVSSANAFVLRGAVPVFIDIRRDTLNLDERRIETAVTPKTKAIVVVHYAGVACDMDVIMEIAKCYELIVIEDAAHGTMSTYKGRALGSIGHLGCYSFHETKNIISGEGGALLVNSSEYSGRAEILREKGTNRSDFFRGNVDKYTWVDIGSSYLPSEIIAAFLWAQMENADEITARRLRVWQMYYECLRPLAETGVLSLPVVTDGCGQNAHMFYVLLTDVFRRDALIHYLAENGVNAVFHYIPLHSSPAGKNYCRVSLTLEVTGYAADSIVRLPLFVDLSESEIKFVCKKIGDFFDAENEPTRTNIEEG